jgi:hypothetical protein
LTFFKYMYILIHVVSIIVFTDFYIVGALLI